MASSGRRTPGRSQTYRPFSVWTQAILVPACAYLLAQRPISSVYSFRVLQANNMTHDVESAMDLHITRNDQPIDPRDTTRE